MASHITRRRVLVGPWLATVLCLMPSIAFAANYFSVVSLANETPANLTISNRWGVEAWHEVPGAKHWFSWKHSKPNEGRSLAFDVVLDREFNVLEYFEAKKLRGFAAESENLDLGHQHAFRHGPSKRHIELWDINPPDGRASPWPPQGKRID